MFKTMQETYTEQRKSAVAVVSEHIDEIEAYLKVLSVICLPDLNHSVIHRAHRS